MTPRPPRPTLLPYTTLFRSATRALQRAYDDAIALCESLENDTRGTSPLHLVREAAQGVLDVRAARKAATRASEAEERSEEHTSELQSPCNLVCRLLLEKKKP